MFKLRILISYFLILGIGASCKLPSSVTSVVTPTMSVSPTIIVTPTPTLTPTPTTTPTPIPSIRVATGDRALFFGDWDKAIREYQLAMDSNPDPEIHSAALSGIGKIYLQMGDYSTALSILREIISTYPDSPHIAEAYLAIAQTFNALYRFSEAAEAFADYLEIRPGIIDSYVQEFRGDALFAAGDYLNAIDAFQFAIAAPRSGDSIPVEIKIGRVYAASGDHASALVVFSDVYTRTTNDYTKAQMDYLSGQSYTDQGQYEDAYKSYLDAVENFPLSYYSYQGLILLVEAGYPVSEFDRGLVDHFAGQHGLSIVAFDRYLNQMPADHPGSIHYYKGLSFRSLDDPQSAIDEWDILIETHPNDPYLDEAYEQKAYTQWAYMDQYDQAIETLLYFVTSYPLHQRAAEFLFDAARVSERKGDLESAATLWQRIAVEFPNSDYVSRSTFLNGISYYRTEDYQSALAAFQQSLGNATTLSDRAAAYLWIGKTQQMLGDNIAANVNWQLGADTDPTGYYSERSRELLAKRPPFDPPQVYDIAYDLQLEQAAAEDWLRETFPIPLEGFSSLGPISNDPRISRGTELWNIGLYEEARAEFDSLRLDIIYDPLGNYQLTKYLIKLGLYRSGIFSARQILNLAGMDDAATLNAPAFFNHVRFGTYYKRLVLPAAERYGFHPLFLFSVTRQESLFEGYVRSSAGARGLMQIMPSTGESIAARLGWPENFSSEDLYRPLVSIILGSDYLASQRDYFGGNLFSALAAYNAGPGNASIWHELAGGDPDLFLEIIRFDETRRYIMGIHEIFSIYRQLYNRTP